MGKGGGGASGSVNFPTYMKEIHYNWLSGGTDAVVIDTMTFSIADLMEATMRTTLPQVSTASMYANLTATDPDGTFFDTGDTLSTYAGQSAYKLLQLFLAEDPEGLYTTYATDASATAMIDAFTTDLDAQYNDAIIPSLNVGFADLNATMSSAYTIAAAGVASQKTREVAKFTADIKTRHALQRVQMKMEWRRLLSVLSTENSRIYLAAKHEEDEVNTDYLLKDATWDLNLYQYGNAVLASISGAGSGGGQTIPKPSVLGATMSGAAGGAMVGASMGTAGGPYGVAIGAAIGGTLGFASTL